MGTTQKEEDDKPRRQEQDAGDETALSLTSSSLVQEPAGRTSLVGFACKKSAAFANPGNWLRRCVGGYSSSRKSLELSSHDDEVEESDIGRPAGPQHDSAGSTTSTPRSQSKENKTDKETDERTEEPRNTDDDEKISFDFSHGLSGDQDSSESNSRLLALTSVERKKFLRTFYADVVEHFHLRRDEVRGLTLREDDKDATAALVFAQVLTEAERVAVVKSAIQKKRRDLRKVLARYAAHARRIVRVICLERILPQRSTRPPHR